MLPSLESGTATMARLFSRPKLLDAAAIRVIAMVGLFTGAAVYQASLLTALTDSDIWWHLSTGTWMLNNHAIPRSGLFSQSATLPWVDSNWGFDLIVGTAWRLFGLRGIPILSMAVQAAIAAALFLLAGETRRNFWLAAVLTAIGQYCLFGLKPRPSLFSILFFVLELTLLFRSRRSGNLRPLLWLPLLFLPWVNLDRQFVYGLMALALFYAATAVEYLARRSGSTWFAKAAGDSSFRVSSAIFGASCLATLLSPDTYHLHELIWQSATSAASDYYFPELHGMRFRQPQDYLLMLLVMTAFLALGRRRSRDIFQISLLVAASVISFRFLRDTWLVAVVAIGILGYSLSMEEEEYGKRPAHLTWRREASLSAALVVAVMIAGALSLPRNESLMGTVAGTFPVRASDFIRQNHLPQPLFNTYPWGGFLTWYLPEYPVVIDGRVDLYRDTANIPYFKLTQAEIPLESHPGFAQAQTFLLEAKSPIAEALATLPGFSVVYHDDVAYVLVRKN